LGWHLASVDDREMWDELLERQRDIRQRERDGAAHADRVTRFSR
jgi:hypothetical protein